MHAGCMFIASAAVYVDFVARRWSITEHVPKHKRIRSNRVCCRKTFSHRSCCPSTHETQTALSRFLTQGVEVFTYTVLALSLRCARFNAIVWAIPRYSRKPSGVIKQFAVHLGLRAFSVIRGTGLREAGRRQVEGHIHGIGAWKKASPPLSAALGPLTWVIDPDGN